MPRTSKDILAHADELPKRFEDYEPREQDRPTRLGLAPTPSVTLLEHVVAVRKQGLPWSTIGFEVGTSGEAARQKYGPLLAS